MNTLVLPWVPAGTERSRFVLGVLAWLMMAGLTLLLVHREPESDAAVLLWGLATLLALAGVWLLWQGARLLPGAIEDAARHRHAWLLPAGLGAWALFVVEFVCVAAQVPSILLPPPSQVVQQMAGQYPLLIADAVQTVGRAVLPGWLGGAALAVLTALLCERFGFLRRGLLPLGNFVSALPIVGLAPIFVMWFGFDWPSKAAIALVVTYFPVLINTSLGLQQAGRMERDLMRSYAATPGQTLRLLQFPAALPFLFNGLRITVPLALIGAIVAEFFGTPIVGMGFRMSVSLGQMDMAMVWAEIVVAAVIAMSMVAALTLLERSLTFWHPSQRG